LEVTRKIYGLGFKKKGLGFKKKGLGFKTKIPVFRLSPKSRIFDISPMRFKIRSQGHPLFGWKKCEQSNGTNQKV
jgi:hypothetical protein